MGRNLSPVLCKQLANLDEEADSRNSAMKAMESYVKEMDSKSIPLFLSQLSEIRESGSLSEEYLISLYEVLARVHGVNIISHVDSIMEAIVRTLASSGGSFSLQQSCSKVIPAIARYCIDPVMSKDRKRLLIDSLCDPLCQSLLGPGESLSAGAALCLRALVDSDNWQFASDAMVNNVSLNISVALEEKSNQTNPHMRLAMALSEKNSLTVEAYARLLIGSGLRILNDGAKECNSQKRLSAIQMVNFLMMSLDPRSIYSQIDLIVEEMEKYQSDQMAFIKKAAFEALQTARSVIGQKKERKSEMDSTTTFQSKNTSQDKTHGINVMVLGNQSPESHSRGSSWSDSVLELPNSPTWISSELDSAQIFDDRAVNVSLKDGIFSLLGHEHDRYPESEHWGNQDMDDNGGNNSHEFIGFVLESPSSGTYSQSLPPSPRGQEELDDIEPNRSHEFMNQTPSVGADSQNLAPSPQKSPSKFYISNQMLTSRKLVYSLQNTVGRNSGPSIGRQNGLPPSSQSYWSHQTGNNDFNGCVTAPNSELGEKESGNMCLGDDHIQVGPKSVLHQHIILQHKEVKQRSNLMTLKKIFVVICSILFLLLAVITSPLWIANNQVLGHARPT
ncbi:hypothetical protein SAY86_027724 [Trapa natans]|uniref:TORTIFOLIA1/SINE1-2 N-terminal domain-containing protein n=1 Tax=Trapa natans TaxID=22666 RepID=A0AAN7KRA8_TRANT|nr:hypothetical protein SAY86_027724 [Trapa natans]